MYNSSPKEKDPEAEQETEGRKLDRHHDGQVRRDERSGDRVVSKDGGEPHLSRYGGRTLEHPPNATCPNWSRV